MKRSSTRCRDRVWLVSHFHLAAKVWARRYSLFVYTNDLAFRENVTAHCLKQRLTILVKWQVQLFIQHENLKVMVMHFAIGVQQLFDVEQFTANQRESKFDKCLRHARKLRPHRATLFPDRDS